jgi:hypothetical protein
VECATLTLAGARRCAEVAGMSGKVRRLLDSLFYVHVKLKNMLLFTETSVVSKPH